MGAPSSLCTIFAPRRNSISSVCPAALVSVRPRRIRTASPSCKTKRWGAMADLGLHFWSRLAPSTPPKKVAVGEMSVGARAHLRPASNAVPFHVSYCSSHYLQEEKGTAMAIVGLVAALATYWLKTYFIGIGRYARESNNEVAPNHLDGCSACKLCHIARTVAADGPCSG